MNTNIISYEHAVDMLSANKDMEIFVSSRQTNNIAIVSSGNKHQPLAYLSLYTLQRLKANNVVCADSCNNKNVYSYIGEFIG